MALFAKKVEKAQIIVEQTGKEYPVMYNPSEYTDSWTSGLNGEGNNVRFSKVNKDDFTVNLFFNTYGKTFSIFEIRDVVDVRTETDPIRDLIKPTFAIGKNKVPYTCIFSWGDFSYRGVVKNVSLKFTMFSPSGTPLRAEMALTFKSLETPVEHADSSGITDSRKYWTVQEGDSLESIALATLNDESLWREIALENGITDVLNFPTREYLGETLIIPNYYNVPEEG